MPLKLRGDAPPSASRRSGRYVATQRAVHRDAVGGTSGQGMHEIRDKDARDSGQLLFFREKCCIFAMSFKDRLN